MKLALTAVLAFLVTQAPARADQIRLLDRGDQSLSAFYAAIRGANKSIDMASFLFEACDSAPKLLLKAMVEKAKKGVHVRLLVDAYSLKQPNKGALPAYLASVPNFEIRYYNDAFTLVGNNMRSHVKAFVVDGRTYIVGGRNMTDEYFGLSGKMNYVDHDLLVTGASAVTAQNRFNELWSAGGRASASGDARAFAASCLATNARDAAVAQWVAAQGPAALDARPQRSCPVLYTLDRPDFDSCQSCTGASGEYDPQAEYLAPERLLKKRMTRMFLDFAGDAGTKLEIVNQYYMPVNRMDETLAELRGKRVAVDVISNATGDIEVPSRNASFTCYIQSAAFRTTTGSQRVSLITSKGALGTPWELSVPGASWRIHAKSAIRDSRDVLVSSYNIDPRSYHTNLESGAVVSDCPDLAGDLEKSYDVLRKEVAADRTCAGCAADIVPVNLSAGVNCGGTPDLY